MQRLVIALFFLCASTTFAQRKQVWPENFDGAKKVVYKTIGEVKLHVHVFRPAKKTSNAPGRAGHQYIFYVSSFTHDAVSVS